VTSTQISIEELLDVEYLKQLGVSCTPRGYIEITEGGVEQKEVMVSVFVSSAREDVVRIVKAVKVEGMGIGRVVVGADGYGDGVISKSGLEEGNSYYPNEYLELNISVSLPRHIFDASSVKILTSNLEVVIKENDPGFGRELESVVARINDVRSSD